MYANAYEVETNIGRPLSDYEVGQVELWITWAERTISARLGDLSLLDSATLNMVVVEAVTARLRAPEPVTQVDVQVDDASVSKRYQRSSGLIEILPEWWRALGIEFDGAFSISPFIAAASVS